MRHRARIPCGSAPAADPVAWKALDNGLEADTMAMLLTERWPDVHTTGRPGQGDEPAGDGAQDVLGDMAALLRDTAPGLTACAAGLGTVTIGLAVEAAALPVTHRPAAAIAACAGLFVILVLCWLRTVTLLVLAGLPLGRALGQQRVHTGAPLDPRPPWATIPMPGAGAGQWGRAQVHLLLSQARFRCERIQLALNWTFITTVSFLAWSAALLFTR
jgi:hypothetical protein